MTSKLSLRAADSERLIQVRQPTALHIAAQNNDLDRIRAFLEKSPHWINVRDEKGNTPLHYAAVRGHHAAMSLLMRRGARTDIKSKKGFLPFDYAAAAAQKKLQNIFGLVDSLALLVPDNPSQTTMRRYAATADVFIKTYGSFNFFGAIGYTRLHWAVERNYSQLTYHLIKESPELVNRKGPGGRAPIHLAAQYKRPHILSALVAAGADLFAKDKDGYTALHTAVAWENFEMVDLILKLAESQNLNLKKLINLQDKKGATPLSIAKERNAKMILISLEIATEVSPPSPDSSSQEAPSAQPSKRELGHKRRWNGASSAADERFKSLKHSP